MKNAFGIVIYGVINQTRVFKRGLTKVSDAQSLEVYPRDEMLNMHTPTVIQAF